MPIHEFKCDDCGEIFDRILTFKEYDLYSKRNKFLMCPKCDHFSNQHVKIFSGKTHLKFVGKWEKTGGY